DAAVPDHGTRRARPVRQAQRGAGVRGLRARPRRGLRDPDLARRARLGRRPRVRRDRHAPVLATQPVAVRRTVRPPEQLSGSMSMHRRRSQLTIAAVAFVLGLLVVVQLRSQAGAPGLAQLSAQDLTVLVANLNDRNDQLRREGASLERELNT